MWVDATKLALFENGSVGVSWALYFVFKLTPSKPLVSTEFGLY